METPPQFTSPSGPPKRSNTVLIVVLVILGLCALCCGGVIFAGLGVFNKMKGSISCITHFTLTRMALSDYAAAHGGKLPPASTWQDDIIPFYGKQGSGKSVSGGGILDTGDPSKDLGCPVDNGAGPTGMAFNSDLGGKTVDEAKKNPQQIILFEVPEVGRNLHMPYKAPPGQSPIKIFGQPRDWITVPVEGQANINPKGNGEDNRGVSGL